MAFVADYFVTHNPLSDHPAHSSGQRASSYHLCGSSAVPVSPTLCLTPTLGPCGSTYAVQVDCEPPAPGHHDDITWTRTNLRCQASRTCRKMAPSKKRQYSPLNPSPLNPNATRSHTNNLDSPFSHPKTTKAPSRRQTLNRHRNRNHNRQHSFPSPPYNNNSSSSSSSSNHSNHISPTQYLLRQKAAAAWRSETLHRHVLLVSISSATATLPSPASKPYLASELVESPLVRSGKVLGSINESDGGGLPVARRVRFADVDEGGEGGDIGLGVGIASEGVDISMDAGDGRWSAAENEEGRGMEGLPLLAAEPVPEAEPGRGQKGVRPVRDGSRVGVTVRRVFAVLGLIVGLGLIHGLVEAFGGMGRETRPRPPGPAGTWSGKV